MEAFYLLLRKIVIAFARCQLQGNERVSVLKFYSNFILTFQNNVIVTCIYPTIASKTPAATAEPITPATFGPIACMSRKF